MRKIFTSALLVTLSGPTFATTSDQHLMMIQNNPTSDSFSLNAETTRTEYRTQTIEDTCYRQEISGYRRVCDNFIGINQIIGSANVRSMKPISALVGSVSDSRGGGSHDSGGSHGGGDHGGGDHGGGDHGGGDHGGGDHGGGDHGGGDHGGGNHGGGDHGGGNHGGGDHGGGDHGGGDHGGGDHGGGDHGDGDHGHDGPDFPREPICHDEAVYTTVAYACTRTVSTPYEVFDHKSTANVNVNISAAPATKPQTSNCGINFNLTGDSLEARNTCDEYLAITQQQTEGNGNLKNYNFAVKLYDAQTVLAPLAGGLAAMRVEGNELIVQTGNLVGATNFTLKLYVQRRKFFTSDIVLINRNLTAKEFSYEPSNETTGEVHINLSKLISTFEPNRKNVIKLDLDVKLDTGTILNGGALPSLHQTSTITIY